MYRVEKLFKGQWLILRRLFETADSAEAFASLLELTSHDICRVVRVGGESA